MSSTNGTKQSFVLFDGTTTEARNEWTGEIIAWLEDQLAWHTALTPAGRKAIKLGIRKYLDPTNGIYRGQGKWAKEAKISRYWLGTQLKAAVEEGLLVANREPRMRPSGWTRGGQTTNVYFPNVPVEVCPGIADLEPEITPKLAPKITPKITPKLAPNLAPEVLTDEQAYGVEVPFGDEEDYVAEDYVEEASSNGHGPASAPVVVGASAADTVNGSSETSSLHGEVVPHASVEDAFASALLRTASATAYDPYLEEAWASYERGESTMNEYLLAVADYRAFGTVRAEVWD